MGSGDEANNSDCTAFESIGAMLRGYVLSFTESRRKNFRMEDEEGGGRVVLLAAIEN
jgi:hypothetical protein